MQQGDASSLGEGAPWLDVRSLGSHLGFVQVPEGIEDPVQVTSVLLNVIDVLVPLLAQLFLRKSLGTRGSLLDTVWQESSLHTIWLRAVP